MHEPVFFIAVAWASALLVTSAAAVVRLRTTAARILALDTLTVVLVALLVVLAVGRLSSYYMDAALVLALLAFVSTLFAARYHGEREVL